jgi:beta-mannosidase
MDLDVDTLTGRGWHRRWTELTGRPMLTKFPYSAHNEMDSLRSYLHSLEIEQAVADHTALSMLRSRSSSCSGIVYWSLNKGGPLFQFGAVDYGLRPMMSHYVVRRLFRDLVVTAYRDIDDVRVVVSNVSPREVEGELRLRHLRVDGEVRHEETVAVRLPAGGTTRVLDVAGLYARVEDRAGEVVHAELSVEGAVRAEDTLFLCPLADVDPGRGDLHCELGRDDLGRPVLHVETGTVAKLVEIEVDRRFLASDDYFALVPGRRRSIVLEPLEPFEGATVTVSALGRPGIQEFRL